MHRPDSAARRGFVVPALWAAAIEQRRAELAARGEKSREQWRADERSAWMADLYEALDAIDRSASGKGMDNWDGLTPMDPAAALAEVVAVAAAWYDAMVDPGRAPAAIGG